MDNIVRKGFLLPEDLEKVDDGEKGKGRKYYIKDIGAVDSVTSILDKGFPKAYSLIQWFIKNTQEDIEKKRKESTDKGTRAHLAFENLAKGNFNFNNLTSEDNNIVEKLKSWVLEYQPIMRHVECAICYITNTLKTAGRVDLICNIAGEDWVIDFKTGKDFYPSYSAQVSLYAKSLGIKKAGLLLLADTKQGWKFKEVNVEKGMKAFEAAYFLGSYKGE